MDGNPPWGGQGTPTPPSGALPPMPTNAGPSLPPPWPPQPGNHQQRRGLLVPIGVCVAVLLAATALVVALVNGNGKASPAPGPTQSASPEPAEVLVDDADRDLCEAIAPLMKESLNSSNTLTDSGPPDSPEYRAAIPKFVTDTKNWAVRTQQVLNDHSAPSRYVTRTLQRYIDDMMYFVEIVAPGRDRGSYEFEKQTWDLGIVDYQALRGRCIDVGSEW